MRLLYAVSDGIAESWAWITIYVGDAPILRADYYEVPEDGVLDIVSASEGVLANDEDPLGRSWESRIVPESVPSPALGEVTLRGDGTFTFIAGPEWTCGSETSFAYTLHPAIPIFVGILVTLVAKGCTGSPTPAPTAAAGPLIDWGKAKATGVTKPGTLYGDLEEYEVPLRGGRSIKVLKRTGGVTIAGMDQRYNCHGYTFGGSTATSGPFIIDVPEVPTILKAGYHPIPEKDVKPGDIAVFWEVKSEPGKPPLITAVHSAVVKEAKHKPDGSLDLKATTFRMKNGIMPFIDGMPYGALRGIYKGTTVRFYRAK